MDTVLDDNMALVWSKKTVIGSAQDISNKISEEILRRIDTVKNNETNIVVLAHTSDEDR